MSDDPVIQDVVSVARRAAYDKVFDLLGTIDDEMADDVMSYMLARKWMGSYTGTDGVPATGEARFIEWMALGRAVEESRKHLTSGFGGGKFSAPGNKQRVQALIAMMYEQADKYMARLRGMIRENQSDSSD